MDFALAVAVSTMATVVFRAVSGEGWASLQPVGYCILFAGSLALAASRQGVTPAEYWRHRRDKVFPASSQRDRRSPQR